MKIVYTTHATATGGGRNEGLSKTDDGNLSVKLTSPKEMGGTGAEGTNPEQLFAVGYAACFLGALRFVAGKAKWMQLRLGHRVFRQAAGRSAELVNGSGCH